MDVDALAKTKGGRKGGNGKDKGGKSEKFDGNCIWCGLYGHMQKDCWAMAAGKPKAPKSLQGSDPRKRKKRRTEAVMTIQQEVQIKESRWDERAHKKVEYMIQRKVRHLFWYSAQIEEGWRSSSTEKLRKDGDLQLTQQESPMKGQAVRIESIRWEESLLQSTTTWEQLWEQKQLIRSQVTKGESPKHGLMYEEVGVSCWYTCVRLDPQG